MNYDRKGFTLAEILGVIVIIGLLLIIIAPAILNRLRSNRDEAEESNNKIIYSAADQYISENDENYPAGKQYCIPIRTLIEEGKLASPVKNILTGETMDDKYSILVTLFSAGQTEHAIMEGEECTALASLPMIDFDITPSGTSWVPKRTVTVKYPITGTSEYPLASSQWRYRRNKENWINLSEGNLTNINNYRTYKVDFTAVGSISGRMKYGDNYVEKSIALINIDSIPPTITIDESNLNKCTNHNLKVKIADNKNGSGVGGYVIKNVKQNPTSSEWISSKAGTITYQVPQNGIYYIYLKDRAGNISSKNTSNIIITNSVIFDANGGSVNITSKTVTNSSTYGTLPTPTRYGYTFKGWYTAKTNGTKVNSTDKVCLTSNQTLYARWEINLATTGSCKSLTYSGSAQTLASGGQNVTYSNNSRTDAGSQTVTVTAKENYIFSDEARTKTLTCTIARAKTATTGSCNSRTYNGSSQTLASGGNYVTYSNNTRTVAGNQTVTVTADNNHLFSNGSATSTLTCSIARARTATTGSCDSRTYNGSAQTLASGGSHVTYSNNSRTDAGSQTVTITADSNYAFSDGNTTKTLSCTIARLRSATTGSCRSGLIANGSSQMLASGGSYVTYSNNYRTASGSQRVTVSADSNYAFSDGGTSKTLTCSITDPCSSVYYVNGSTCSASCGGGTYNRYAYSNYNGQRCSGQDRSTGGSACNTHACYITKYTCRVGNTCILSEKNTGMSYCVYTVGYGTAIAVVDAGGGFYQLVGSNPVRYIWNGCLGNLSNLSDCPQTCKG